MAIALCLGQFLGGHFRLSRRAPTRGSRRVRPRLRLFRFAGRGVPGSCMVASAILIVAQFHALAFRAVRSSGGRWWRQRFRAQSEPGDQLPHLLQRQGGPERIIEHLPLAAIGAGRVGVDQPADRRVVFRPQQIAKEQQPAGGCDAPRLVEHLGGVGNVWTMLLDITVANRPAASGSDLPSTLSRAIRSASPAWTTFCRAN